MTAPPLSRGGGSKRGAVTDVVPPDPPPDATDPTAECAKCASNAVYMTEDGRRGLWRECRARPGCTLELAEIAPG